MFWPGYGWWYLWPGTFFTSLFHARDIYRPQLLGSPRFSMLVTYIGPQLVGIYRISHSVFFFRPQFSSIL